MFIIKKVISALEILTIGVFIPGTVVFAVLHPFWSILSADALVLLGIVLYVVTLFAEGLFLDALRARRIRKNKATCLKEGHIMDQTYMYPDVYFYPEYRTSGNLTSYRDVMAKGNVAGKKCSRCGFEDYPEDYHVCDSFTGYTLPTSTVQRIRTKTYSK